MQVALAAFERRIGLGKRGIEHVQKPARLFKRRIAAAICIRKLGAGGAGFVQQRPGGAAVGGAGFPFCALCGERFLLLPQPGAKGLGGRGFPTFFGLLAQQGCVDFLDLRAQALDICAA